MERTTWTDERLDERMAAMDQTAERIFAELAGIREEMRASRSDMSAFRGEVKSEIGDLRDEVRSEIGGLRSEVRSEIGGLRSEVKREIGGLRSEVKSEIGGLRGEMSSLRGEVKSEVRDLRIEVGELRAGVRSDAEAHHANLNRFQDRMVQVGFGLLGVTIAAIAGIVIAAITAGG